MSAYDPHDHFPWPQAIGVVVLVVLLYFWYRSGEECRARGGVQVRGMLWYECATGLPIQIKLQEETLP